MKIGEKVIHKKSKVWNCYSCKEKLDSKQNITCDSCGWLICYCGACGCGYTKM